VNACRMCQNRAPWRIALDDLFSLVVFLALDSSTVPLSCAFTCSPTGESFLSNAFSVNRFFKWPSLSACTYIYLRAVLFFQFDCS